MQIYCELDICFWYEKCAQKGQYEGQQVSDHLLIVNILNHYATASIFPFEVLDVIKV